MQKTVAKAIYSLKIFMFQHQFTLTAKDKNNVKELVLFISLIYIRFWCEAPRAGKSSFNDVQLVQALENYQNRTRLPHLLRRQNIDVDVKRKMVANLKLLPS